jgi:hypothetical protein
MKYKVIAIHKVTGRPQFMSVFSLSQESANSYVSKIRPNWIVVPSHKTAEL